MIPIVTAFAIAHDVDLYYRYEKVYQIRKTHVPPIFSERDQERPSMNVPEAEKSGNPFLRAIGFGDRTSRADALPKLRLRSGPKYERSL